MLLENNKHLDSPRLIAFYLPQYHPIPENDEWWGKGFTEWTNVAKAKPLFKGHYQPHLPTDLGFYDLRVPEVRQAQADMAREYGIYGFCYYHYWFSGKQLLERPFQEVLESGKPDFPFCLCWANENWTRRWDGQDQEIILLQEYSKEDDYHHIQELIRSFRDDRYIKIEGKPLLLVYRVNNLPNVSGTAALWRECVKSAGFPDLFLCSVTSSRFLHFDATEIGFDAAVDFVPDWKNLQKPKKPIWYKNKIIKRVMMRLFGNNAYAKHAIRDYSEFAMNMIKRPIPNYKLFPGVTPGWDNSPRKKIDGIIFTDSNPEIYGTWLEKALQMSCNTFPNPEERLVFINAWNEWGEGNHLEPDQRWGLKYLETTRNTLDLFKTNNSN